MRHLLHRLQGGVTEEWIAHLPAGATRPTAGALLAGNPEGELPPMSITTEGLVIQVSRSHLVASPSSTLRMVDRTRE